MKHRSMGKGMRKKFGLTAAGLLILGMTIIGGTFGQHKRLVSRSNVDITNKIESDYNTALQFIGANYAGEVDYEKANQAAIQGMLWTLDPHSTFFPQVEYRKLREDQDSRFYGIGVSILRHRDGVYVQAAVPNTPAASAGLRFGDRIVEIDGQDVRDWSTDRVSKAVRGDLGKSVKVKIERTGFSSPLEVTIVRAAVPLPSIRTVYMVRPGIGYIGLNNGFQHTTGNELRSTIKSLKQQGMAQLVLDLRSNPGGLLDQAIDVVGQFIPRGQVVVSVRGREYAEPVIYKSNGTETESFPLVTLIDRSSASASEIVAGAIQDHGRGLIIGDTSFGKALVQRVYSIPFGTGLTLTTGKYYTPYGRSIQRDYSNGSIYEYYTHHTAPDEETKPTVPAVGHGVPGGVTNGASPGTTGTTNVSPTPAPISHPPSGPAVKTAAGRIFYGGGGITPDIAVNGIDYSPVARRAIAEAAFYFTRQLITGQLPGLESYRVNAPQPDSFPTATDFPVTDKVIEAFRNFVQSDKSFNLTGAQIDKEIEIAKLRLRFEIVTAAYSVDAGTRILLEKDPQLLKGVESLPDARRLAESIRNGEQVSQLTPSPTPRSIRRRDRHRFDFIDEFYLA